MNTNNAMERNNWLRQLVKTIKQGRFFPWVPSNEETRCGVFSLSVLSTCRPEHSHLTTVVIAKAVVDRPGGIARQGSESAKLSGSASGASQHNARRTTDVIDDVIILCRWRGCGLWEPISVVENFVWTLDGGALYFPVSSSRNVIRGARKAHSGRQDWAADRDILSHLLRWVETHQNDLWQLV